MRHYPYNMTCRLEIIPQPDFDLSQTQGNGKMNLDVAKDVPPSLLPLES